MGSGKARPVDDVDFGRYRLIELLARGGMGEVYRAHDTMLRRDVAVKVLPPELASKRGYRERFEREAYTAARLTEPHVIPIHEFGEMDGRLYLVMPLVDGIDVHTLLERDGPMSPMLAVRVVEQAATALDAAHRSGLVHRDVKPSNLMMVDGGEFVYLIDFGIAADTTEIDVLGDPVRSTNPGEIVGSMAYMAPERFASSTADARADVYSLACVLCECLTGAKPFPGDSIERQVVGHLTVDPPKPSEVNPAVPSAFDAVIARGMAKSPDERYQTAGELAVAARNVLTRAAASAPRFPKDVPTEGVEFGRYRLLGFLGEGAMGRVYRARDTAMGRDVAIKVLAPELASEPGYQERFRREASAAGRLASPNIIPVYDAGEIDGRLYLVMPLVDGVDVHNVLTREGPMSPARAVRVIVQVAAALDTAHQHALVHRDVKPSNMLMTGNEAVYLIDFGVAHDARASRLTRSHVALGSWAYMAPERFSKGNIDGRSDVYSLACVLYECLTGQLPFAPDSHEQLVVEHLYSPPPKPSSVDSAIPVGFDEVVARGMAKSPDKRYQTGHELAVAACHALATAPLAVSDPGSRYRSECAVVPPPTVRARLSPPPPSGWSAPTISTTTGRPAKPDPGHR